MRGLQIVPINIRPAEMFARRDVIPSDVRVLLYYLGSLRLDRTTTSVVKKVMIQFG